MTAPFLFGKLPSHGDFVMRGLTPARHRSFDDWLSASLGAARGEMGDAFDDRYDRAPPWRFVWEDDAGWWAGALIPSMDGAGRRFPLIGGIIGTAPRDAAGVAEAVEDILTRALVGGWHADETLAALAGAGGVEAVPPPAGWWTLGGGEASGVWFPPAHLAGPHPPALIRTMVTPA